MLQLNNDSIMKLQINALHGKNNYINAFAVIVKLWEVITTIIGMTVYPMTPLLKLCLPYQLFGRL